MIWRPRPEKSAARPARGGIELRPSASSSAVACGTVPRVRKAPACALADYLRLGERRGIIAAYLHDDPP